MAAVTRNTFRKIDFDDEFEEFPADCDIGEDSISDFDDSWNYYDDMLDEESFDGGHELSKELAKFSIKSPLRQGMIAKKLLATTPVKGSPKRVITPVKSSPKRVAQIDLKKTEDLKKPKMEEIKLEKTMKGSLNKVLTPMKSSPERVITPVKSSPKRVAEVDFKKTEDLKKPKMEEQKAKETVQAQAITPKGSLKKVLTPLISSPERVITPVKSSPKRVAEVDLKKTDLKKAKVEEKKAEKRPSK